MIEPTPSAGPRWTALLCCPMCHAALRAVESAAAVECARCAQRYPVVDGGLPVLLATAERHLARTAIKLRESLAGLDDEIRSLKDVCWAESLPDLLRTCRDALVHKRATLEGFLAPVVAAVSPAALLTAAVAAPALRAQVDPAVQWGYLDNDDYLMRDWSGAAATEAELAGLERALDAQLDAAAPDTELAVVLGAGTGRLAWDLQTRFRSVVALDNALTMGLGFRRVVTDGLTAHSVMTSNVRSRADVVWTAQLSQRVARVQAPAAEAPVHFAIADGTALPLPDACASVVFSVYFTDLVPLPLLLREVSRVLRPGGLFVHFGPLKGHMGSRWDLVLTPEDVLAELARRGFRVVGQDWVRLAHRARPGAMFESVYDNWCLAARAPVAHRPVTLDSVLAFCRSAVISGRTPLAAQRDQGAATLEIRGVEATRVSVEVVAVVEGADGRRTVAQLFAALGAQGVEFDDASQRKILATLEGFVAVGLLEVVAP